MAEAALLSVALDVAGTIASSSFNTAFEKACFIWGAKDELQKITDSIETIKGGLLDAEKRQEGSDLVKALIRRLRVVLYEAEELFDEVATNELLKQQMEPFCIPLKEVQIFFSKLSPLLSSYSIASKVREIRDTMDQISKDMDSFNFAHLREDPVRVIRDSGSFVVSKKVLGRDNDRDLILKFLYEKSHSLVAIVGIGGMGKSCLARHVYNDKQIETEFGKEGMGRWWVCISNTSDEKEVTRKIYQSLTGKVTWKGLSLHKLQSGISKCVNKKEKFFLVLDDIWDEDAASWDKILSLLRSGDAKESKIIITTRSLTVADAMGVDDDNLHMLRGLTNDASWELFKRFAFKEGEKIDWAQNSLGREIVKKCANVPLAIECIGSLLRRKDTIEEWNYFARNELPEISRTEDPDYVMSVLKLSYDFLPSKLKHCFAYCSLFPKKSVLEKKSLIYLWMAQGYIKPDDDDDETGHACFMDLYRRGFFEVEKVDNNGDIVSYKMHDLIHDLARQVAGDESIILVDGLSEFDGDKFRHVSVGNCKIDSSWSFPPALLQPNCMRSLLFLPRNYPEPLQVIDETVMELRLLRALSLEGLKIEDVPSSIGDLKFLRYLNLSRNVALAVLPDSITELVNLLTLDVSDCKKLKLLPNGFRKLVSLRHLDITGCESMKHMPSGFGKLTSLQHLSDFKVRKSGGDGVNALVGLKLKGQLSISYDENDEWIEDELMLERGQISKDIESLTFNHYPFVRMPVWWMEDPTLQTPRLKSLTLEGCKKVKQLPLLRCLPNLGYLILHKLIALEYMEEDEEVLPNAPFFPSLVFLELTDLSKLKGWSRRQGVTTASFPNLSRLSIHRCNRLKSMPPSPHLHQLSLINPTQEMVQQLVSTNASSLSSLESITITSRSVLKSFPGEGLASVRRLELLGWPHLESVQLAENAGVEELTIHRCPKLKLWGQGEEKVGVDWGRVASLRVLVLDQIPEAKDLPNCLVQRVEQGLLQIKKKK